MKILGSDFDGTLNYGGIDQAKCDAIDSWRRAGHLFGLVSGRGPGFLRNLRNQYPTLHMDFFVAYNGAFIVDAEGKTLDTTVCDGVSALDLTADLLAWGCPFVCASGVNGYTARKDGEPLRDGECAFSDLPGDFPWFYQVSVQLETYAAAEAMTHKLKEVYGDRLNPLQNGVCIDIVAPTVNKAAGLRRLAALFGGNEADIIAVGDNINDLDMLKAFRSYAMENGVEEVKRVSGQTVESVIELIRLELST
ncbi:MAG: HAD family phosphatase [Ruminococcaceae bacterium]|nr:HAD family phosphatase [Oscillospiraceae bacterium]